MIVGQIAAIALAIVTVAGVTVAVSSPNTSNIIGSFGSAFSNSVKAAMGQYA